MKIINEKDVDVNRVPGEKGFIDYQNLFKADKIGITLTTIEHDSFAPKPVHSHKEKQFNFIIEGEGIMICGGREIDVKVGELIIFDSWEDHSFKAMGSRLKSVEIKLYE